MLASSFDFTVKLDRFEGPYTKLLEFIETRKLSITEITLASVSDEYIAYIKSLRATDIVDMSQFIVVASTLVLIKAKSLLPSIVYTQEEEKQVHDLEYKLELYKLLEEACTTVKHIYNVTPLHGRHYSLPADVDVFVPDSRLTAEFLQSIADLTLLTLATSKALTNVSVEQTVRIETVIENLLKHVETSLASVSLQSISGDIAAGKEEQKKILITHFIALLELLRSGSVDARQDDMRGDIFIEKAGSKQPLSITDVHGVEEGSSPVLHLP